jgi:hypothetical protein
VAGRRFFVPSWPARRRGRGNDQRAAILSSWSARLLIARSTAALWLVLVLVLILICVLIRGLVRVLLPLLLLLARRLRRLRRL